MVQKTKTLRYVVSRGMMLDTSTVRTLYTLRSIRAISAATLSADSCGSKSSSTFK